MARNSSVSHRALGALGLVAVAVFSLGSTVSLRDAMASLISQTEEIQQQADDTKNQQQNLKDQNNYLKNLQREVQDIKKAVKTLDTSAVDTLLSQWQTCLNARSAEVGSSDFWNNIQDCHSLSRDIEDYIRDNLRPQRDCADRKRQVDDRRKEKKNNIDRQVKDILRGDKNADLSAINALISQIDAQFQKADQLNSGGCSADVADGLNDVSSELNSLFQDAYNTMGEVQQKSGEVQRLKQGQGDLKNKKQQCKDMGRELKNVVRENERAKKSGVTSNEEALAAVQSSYGVMCDATNGALVRMEQALNASDADAYEEARGEFDSNNQDYWNTLNDARSGVNEQVQKVETLKHVNRDLQQKQKDLKRVKKDVQRMKKTYDKLAKKWADRADRQQTLSDFAGLIKQINEVAAAYESGLTTATDQAQGDPDSYWYEHNDELNDLQEQFNELDNQARMVGDVLRTLNEATKGVKSARRDLENLKKNSAAAGIIPHLEELLSEAEASFQNAWSIVVSDPEAAMESLQDIFELRRDWDETVSSLYEER